MAVCLLGFKSLRWQDLQGVGLPEGFSRSGFVQGLIEGWGL